jgi:hypothetical protein
MMNGTLLDGLPSASSTRPNGSFRSSAKLFRSVAFSVPVAASMSLPSESFLPHRSSEATQSSGVTGVPSWKRSPSRRVNVYFSASRLTVYVSTICGLIWRFASVANSVSQTM